MALPARAPQTLNRTEIYRKENVIKSAVVFIKIYFVVHFVFRKFRPLRTTPRNKCRLSKFFFSHSRARLVRTERTKQ